MKKTMKILSESDPYRCMTIIKLYSFVICSALKKLIKISVVQLTKIRTEAKKSKLEVLASINLISTKGVTRIKRIDIKAAIPAALKTIVE